MKPGSSQPWVLSCQPCLTLDQLWVRGQGQLASLWEVGTRSLPALAGWLRLRE